MNKYPLLILIVLLLLWVSIETIKTKVSYFKNKGDTKNINKTFNNSYLINRDRKDMKKSDQLLSELNSFSLSLVESFVKTYKNKNLINSSDIKGYKVMSVLKKNYRPSSLTENHPINVNKTSFISNKGEDIKICLREKITGKHRFHDIEVLKFVLLHELAHMITPELEHTVDFWTNFKYLLEYCERYNLYKPINFKLKNTHYCGMTLNYNPYYDTKLKSYF